MIMKLKILALILFALALHKTSITCANSNSLEDNLKKESAINESKIESIEFITTTFNEN